MSKRDGQKRVFCAETYRCIVVQVRGRWLRDAPNLRSFGRCRYFGAPCHTCAGYIFETAAILSVNPGTGKAQGRREGSMMPAAVGGGAFRQAQCSVTEHFDRLNARGGLVHFDRLSARFKRIA